MHDAVYVYVAYTAQYTCNLGTTWRQVVSLMPLSLHHFWKQALLTHWVRDLVGTRVSLEENKAMCNTTHLCLEGTSTALN